MELKDFVAATLTQICQGIEQARREMQESSARIAPPLTPTGTVSTFQESDSVQTVHFDVYLSERGASGKKGGASLGITLSKVSINADISGNKENATTSGHRVSFEIPVVWPTDKPNQPKGFSPKTYHRA